MNYFETGMKAVCARLSKSHPSLHCTSLMRSNLGLPIFALHYKLYHVCDHSRQNPPQGLGEKATPLSEVEFWEGRAADLKDAATQLSGPVILNVSTSLKAAGSTYAKALDR